MPPDLILFDFSGTLARFNFKPKSFFSKLSDFGINVKDEQKAKEIFDFISHLIGFCQNWEEVGESFLQKYILNPPKTLIKKIAKVFEKEVNFVLFPDAKYAFSLPVKKAILSGNSRFIIESAGVPKSVKIFTPAETKYVKPDLRSFLVPLKDFKIEPERTLMVGDEIERDLIPAKKLGMEAILIDRENKFLNPPVKKIKSLKELKEIFTIKLQIGSF